MIHALFAFALWSVTAHADSENVRSERASSSSVPTPDRSANRAKVILIGELAQDPSLTDLLHELLETAGIEAEIVGAERFEPNSLFSDGERAGVMLVFVQLRSARDARLHFRAPSGERFLLRQLELPSGVDAVGRELLGQVIQSSVAVLLHSSKGLSRAEASAALASDADSEPLTSRSNAPAPPLAEPPGPRRAFAPTNEPARPPPTDAGWALRVGVGYALEWAGADLPLAHGPSAALGVRSTTLPHLGLKIGVQRLFAQELRTPLVGGEVQRTDALLLLELGVPLAETQSGFLAFGPALEISRLEPTFGATGVTVTSAKTDLAPALRGEASYELTFGPFVLGATAFAAISLVDTHYDVIDNGARKRIATLGTLRPGGALTLSLY